MEINGWNAYHQICFAVYDSAGFFMFSESSFFPTDFSQVDRAIISEHVIEYGTVLIHYI